MPETGEAEHPEQPATTYNLSFSLVHPATAATNGGMSPNTSELEWAKTVVDAPQALGLCAWLALSDTVASAEELFEQLNQRLDSSGIPVRRASCSLMTKHPEVFGQQVIWNLGAKTKSIFRSHQIVESASYEESPVAYVRRAQRSLRVRLGDRAEGLRYEVCRELKADGFTDYVILPVPFRSGAKSFVSWATNVEGGFTDEHLSTLHAIIPMLSLRMELACSTMATESLLRTYLGTNAATRVLSGAFKRGSGSTLNAVIWSCDLRGFATLVDQNPIQDVLATLDEYFRCAAEPISKKGGEILKFIGDAVLGVFPFETNPEQACTVALEAARLAFDAAAEANERRIAEGKPAIQFGIGLHVGEVLYGSIGTSDRLDFTVIGRAVNETCRVEAMCKALGAPLLATDAFVRHAGSIRAQSLGEHALRGVRATHTLYSIAPNTIRHHAVDKNP